MLALYWQCHANQAGWARNSRYVGSLGKTNVPWRVEIKTSEPQHVNELFRDPNVWIWRKLDHPLQIKQQDIVSPTTAKLHQSCLTLCNPIDGSPSGSSIPGILQARILEWVTISFSNEWKWKVKVKALSHVWLFETPWTVAYQAPPSMEFSRQEYWSSPTTKRA